MQPLYIDIPHTSARLQWPWEIYQVRKISHRRLDVVIWIQSTFDAWIKHFDKNGQEKFKYIKKGKSHFGTRNALTFFTKWTIDFVAEKRLKNLFYWLENIPEHYEELPAFHIVLDSNRERGKLAGQKTRRVQIIQKSVVFSFQNTKRTWATAAAQFLLGTQ